MDLRTADHEDPYAMAGLAADVLRTGLGIDSIQVGVVLGSGWAAAAPKALASMAMADLPGCTTPVVPGHGGQVQLVRAPSGSTVALFSGRTHLYEGRGVAAVTHVVRTLAAAGASRLILTNGAGSIRPEWTPGTVVLISDHINLTGTTPLVGPRFLDLTQAYDPQLRSLARKVDPTLAEGVYVQFPGPAYETPAEVRMVAAIGGDLVGMSAALETIAAREAGMAVLGLSLVTNAAAGVSAATLAHADVVAAGQAVAPRLRLLLAGILARL